ncbi:hypothetical protein [Paraburkholderia sp. DHOC27]|uniref:hypothetical protein n=1 Tax=Paraburkholderia sp. DHOC27 TaxID=2303330 RepID=UPI0015F304FB|nr:hypothetical protein [Paraburkholderia sp. DHOC27]
MFPRWTTDVTLIENDVTLLLVLVAARTIVLTATILAAVLPYVIEFLRRELHGKFDL